MTPQAGVAEPLGNDRLEGGPEPTLPRWEVGSGPSDMYQVGWQFRSGEEAIEENQRGTLRRLFGR